MFIHEQELFDYVYPLIKQIHNIPDNAKIKRKTHIRGLEVDAYIEWRKFYSNLNYYRNYSLILELKISDIDKLLEQLLARRHLALWCYGVLDLSLNDIITYTLNHHEKMYKIARAGIGLITMYNVNGKPTPIILLRSKKRGNTLIEIIQKLLEVEGW